MSERYRSLRTRNLAMPRGSHRCDLHVRSAYLLCLRRPVHTNTHTGSRQSGSRVLNAPGRKPMQGRLTARTTTPSIWAAQTSLAPSTSRRFTFSFWLVGGVTILLRTCLPKSRGNKYECPGDAALWKGHSRSSLSRSYVRPRLLSQCAGSTRGARCCCWPSRQDASVVGRFRARKRAGDRAGVASS